MKNLITTTLFVSFLAFALASISTQLNEADVQKEHAIILGEDTELRDKLRHKGRKNLKIFRKRLRHKGRTTGQLKNKVQELFSSNKKPIEKH